VHVERTHRGELYFDGVFLSDLVRSEAARVHFSCNAAASPVALSTPGLDPTGEQGVLMEKRRAAKQPAQAALNCPFATSLPNRTERLRSALAFGA
jgi:hypothetical protein